MNWEWVQVSRLGTQQCLIISEVALEMFWCIFFSSGGQRFIIYVVEFTQQFSDKKDS